MRKTSLVLVGAAVALSTKASAAVLSLDNFEQYSGSNGTVIGSSSATPNRHVHLAGNGERLRQRAHCDRRFDCGHRTVSN